MSGDGEGAGNGETVMRTIAVAVVVAAGLGVANPVVAEDLPEDSETTESARKATAAVEAEAIRTGAGSMEPSEADAPDDAQAAAERAFAENVWTSP